MSLGGRVSPTARFAARLAIAVDLSHAEPEGNNPLGKELGELG